uniref:Uncharacterized protein n=1 Tax=Tanacetum cinerariifolium TaxID=118510 RepID=A0A6L2P2K1_TANCI|nr:hypothetical protein [Tanacetum cinerariifolium]
MVNDRIVVNLDETGQPVEDEGNEYELKKKFYDLSLTIEKIVVVLNDERVDKEEFKELVTRWFDEKTQVESKTKKLIRSKSNEAHVTGTKSFARITHDEKSYTKERCYAITWRITRTYKDGSNVPVAAADVIDALKNINNTAASSSHVRLLDRKIDDLVKVKGQKKRSYTMQGEIVKAIRKGYHASQDPHVPQLKYRMNELENEVKGMKETQRKMVRFMASFKAANGCPRGNSNISCKCLYIIIVLVGTQHHLMETQHHLVKVPGYECRVHVCKSHSTPNSGFIFLPSYIEITSFIKMTSTLTFAATCASIGITEPLHQIQNFDCYGFC